MKLTIKTIFGERTFELPESIATELIEQAEEASSDSVNETQIPLKSVISAKDVISKHMKLPHNEQTAIHDNATEGWSADDRGYKGFLHIKCEKCGTIKGYCTSRPLHYHRCGCRHNTPLVDLATVKANCKCGESFTYKTNIVEPYFTMNCLACGSPIELELDGNGTSYVTME